MIARLIRLLHVEADEAQRLLVRTFLDRLPEFRFAITYATSEEAAVETFGAGYDFVVLDFGLPDGEGFGCLERIRQMDGSVPIVVVSGEQTPVVAADLVEAGADEHFRKEQLNEKEFGECVRAALARADAWRSRAQSYDPVMRKRVARLFEEICTTFVESVGEDFADRLEELEACAREAHLTVAQTMRLFETACDKLRHSDAEGRTKRLLRPVMFEVIYRLYNEVPSPACV
jgi:DNA-binding response OmpR family regulator